MKPIYSALGWISVYLLLVLAPLFVLLTGKLPAGAGMNWDFSMALGFSAMAVFSVLFLLTARFRRLAAPFGMDIIYFFHRYLALLGLGFVVIHYFILRVYYPDVLGTADPLYAPGYMSAGRAALVLFVLLIISSLWRKQLHIPYEEWRLLHIVLSVSGFLLALIHIEGAGNYIEESAKHLIWRSYTLFWVLLIVYVRLIKPWRMLQKPYQVTQVQEQCCHSWTLTLEPVGHSGIQFKPGQFAWLTLRGNPWQLREHPFSIASSAVHPQSLQFTIKELGDFTRTIKDTKTGDIVYVDAPYGVFSIDQYTDAPGYVFLAGGVGIAPVMRMLRPLADRQDQRSLLLVYGNKHAEDIIFRDEFTVLQQKLNLKVVHVLSEAPADWRGETGVITRELLQKNLDKEFSQCEYFLCGPKPMSDAVQKSLRQLGVPLGQIHFELFDMV